MNIPCTNLRVSYDVCASHIARNLKKNLRVNIISNKKYGMMLDAPIEHLRGLYIREMKESENECIVGMIDFENNTYSFHTHHYAYDAVMYMRNMDYPYDKIRMVLPITTYNDKKDCKIYIPEEFTNNVNVVPVEFVWEFLTQLSDFLEDDINSSCEPLSSACSSSLQ